MSQASRKRKVIEPDSDTLTVTVASAAATSPLILTTPEHTDNTPCTKRQRERLTPINYLDVLPKDVLCHLFFYIKLLDDEEMFALAQTSRTMLTFIQTRYERSGQIKWYLYPLIDIEKRKLKLPWVTPEERNRYVLISSTSQTEITRDSDQSMKDGELQEHNEEEWVVLRHTIDKAILLGLQALPFESFVLNEYQPHRFTIGQITRLHLSQLSPKEPIPPHLPHIRFLPCSSLKQLELTDILINSSEVIQTYVWPQRLQTLTLSGFDSQLFNREMVTRWPPSLQHLILEGGWIGEGIDPTKFTSSDLFFPRSLLQLCVVRGCFAWIEPTTFQLPPDLTELTCRPNQALDGWMLPSSLKILHIRYGFNYPVDKWILPGSLKELKFSDDFNQCIQGMIFNETLTHLNLGGFNHSLVGVTLPATLIHLEFGQNFQQSLLGVTLPLGLKTLIYGIEFDPSILDPYFAFPPSITHLQLGIVMNTRKPLERFSAADVVSKNQFELPPNLKYLQIHLRLLLKLISLPLTIEELVLNSEVQVFNPSSPSHGQLITRFNTILSTMPLLGHLTIDLHNFSVDGLILPPSLEHIKFTRSCRGDFSTVFMGTHHLKQIHYFGNSYLPRIRLPESLEVIRFDSIRGDINPTLDGVVLPSRLRELHFGPSFKEPISDMNFPIGLELLALNSLCFQQSLVECKFPPGLKTIQLSSYYNCSLSGLTIPSSLERFEMGSTNKESEFSHIDSLIHLSFPSSLKLIRLPNPHQASYREHPALLAYKEWLTQLSRLHPYARIEFSRSSGLCQKYSEFNQYDDDDEHDDDDDDDDDDDETTDPVPAPPLVGVELNPGPLGSVDPIRFNYLFSLPNDLLNHLFLYSHLLSDADMYPLAKSCHTISRLIGTRYERTNKNQWFIYRLRDIEAHGLQLPWVTMDERNQYVIDCPSTPPPVSANMHLDYAPWFPVSPVTHPSSSHSFQSHENEWVILTHQLERTLELSWTKLPSHSFVPQEYQPTRFSIGRITTLELSVPIPLSPKVKSTPPLDYFQDVTTSPLNLPHLRFLPHQTLTSLTMTNVLINPIDIIQMYEWPQKFVSSRASVCA